MAPSHTLNTHPPRINSLGSTKPKWQRFVVRGIVMQRYHTALKWCSKDGFMTSSKWRGFEADIYRANGDYYMGHIPFVCLF